MDTLNWREGGSNLKPKERSSNLMASQEKRGRKNRHRHFYWPNKRRKEKPTYDMKPVNRQFKRCADCPYPNHGFLCWGQDSRCLRTIIRNINLQKRNPSEDL